MTTTIKTRRTNEKIGKLTKWSLSVTRTILSSTNYVFF